MIKNKIIEILTGISVLFSACSELDENMNFNKDMESKNAVEVNLSLSFAPEVHLDGNTNYQPMSTRAGDSIKSIIANEYKCLVLKEINNIWYVDTLAKPTLTTDPSNSELKIMSTTIFQDLKLTLRPGHYRILAVLNPRSGEWNPQLVPGTKVKGDGIDTVAHAYKYRFQTGGFANIGKREVKYEIFSGTAEFTVSKTSNLHSNPINGNTHIIFTRKVMQIRFLLKDHISPKDSFNFNPTQHTVHATLKATKEGIPFCDGLDCWGDAYYNHIKPTTELPICTDLDTPWRTSTSSKTKERYKMISSHVTIYSPFVFTDVNTQVPYQLENIKIIGQSGGDGFVYIYPEPIRNLQLKNDTIQQVVFQTTDIVDNHIVEPQRQVTLEHLKEESSKELFGPYYECNLP